MPAMCRIAGLPGGKLPSATDYPRREVVYTGEVQLEKGLAGFGGKASSNDLKNSDLARILAGC